MDCIIQHSKPTLGQEEISMAGMVLASGHISDGTIVSRFERDMASMHGRSYGLAVNSGTSALYIALSMFPTGEVITPSLTCRAVLDAIYRAGHSPVLFDEFKPDDIGALITERTACIVIPYFLGRPMDIEAVMSFGVPVIEDCAQALGSRWNDRLLGTRGTISVFSFYATKMITTGEGGMLLFDDPKVLHRAREIRRHNFKMTDFQAAIGREQLRRLDYFIWKRRGLYNEYDRLFGKTSGIEGYNCYRYILACDNRDKMVNAMWDRGIQCGVGIKDPLHRILHLHKKRFWRSEFIVDNFISLPLYPSLSLEDVARVHEMFLLCQK